VLIFIAHSMLSTGVLQTVVVPFIGANSWSQAEQVAQE